MIKLRDNGECMGSSGLKARSFKPTTALRQTLFSVAKLIIKKQSKIRFDD